jgi:hypothetical protein
VYLAVATRVGTSTMRTHFDNGAYSNFFDIQAEALLRGDLALPANSIGIEAFVVDGREQMYFGLFPALLRLPVVAVTDSLSGQLTVLSSFLAWLVFVVAAWASGGRYLDGRLESVEPRTVRVAVPVLWRIGIALGTPVLMLAGPAWVFSEAIMWGVAAATLFQWRLLRELERPSLQNQLLVGGALVLAVLNRPTLGLGCLLVTVAVVAVRARRGVDGGTWRLIAASGVSAVALVAPNMARFGRPLGPPMEQQVLSQIDEQRIRMLAYAGGDFVDPRYLPTNVLAYVRPDGVSLDGRFPFIDAPTGTPTVLLDAVYDITYRTPSLVATSTALAAFAAIGLVTAWRHRRDAATRRMVLLAGAGLPALATLLVWGFIAPRYLADFLVTLVPLSALGAAAGGRWLGRRSRPTIGWGVAAVAVVTAWSVASNAALALSSSYLTGPDGGAREFVRLQGRDDIWTADRVPDSDGFSFERTDPPAPWRIAVLGRCAAAYVSTGEPVDPWLTLGYGPNEFRRTFSVALPADPVASSTLLATFTSEPPNEPDVPNRFELRLVTDPDGAVRLELSDEFGVVPYPLDVDPGATFEVTATSDPVRRSMFFEVDGQTVHFGHPLTRSLYDDGGQVVEFTDGGADAGVVVEPVTVAAPC